MKNKEAEQIINAVTLEDAKREADAIRASLCKSTKEKITIGQKLKWFKHTKAYEKLGYDTMQDFTEAEYGLKSSSVDNYIKVAKAYSEEKVNNETGEKYIEYSEECDKYSFCQLLAMLPLSKEQRMSIPADASVRKIKYQVMQSEVNARGSVVISVPEPNDTVDEVSDDNNETQVIAEGENADSNQISENEPDDINSLEEDNMTGSFKFEGKTWEDILSKEAEIRNYIGKKKNRRYTISIVVSYE